MLTALRLRDFVIVEQADIAFGEGFTALTGETGAGKSILIDALSLALGARADAAVVRQGATRADLVAEFRISDAVQTWLEARDLAGDPGSLALRRVVESDGRSRALVNGHPATVALLRELGEGLVEIHGQHASQSLLRPEGQRALIDRFGGNTAQLARTSQAHAEWRQLQGAIEAAASGAREIELERERLQWQLEELAPLKPQEAEWDCLEAEQKRLTHAASLIAAAQGAAEALDEADDSIVSRLTSLLHRLRPLAEVDPGLKGSLELLESAGIQAAEAASGLADYARRVDLDPERLQDVESRIGALFAVARKLRTPPSMLAQLQGSLSERLAQLQASSDLDALGRQLDAARKRYDEAAGELGARRREAALTLSRLVSQRLAALGMDGARLEVSIAAAEPAAHGADRVEFLIGSHSGSNVRPLSRVASGGELSRISLAISELAAQANPVATLIFDEADAGVGGAVAEVIGASMRRLGETRQVLCVTHLPQVAAQAHAQWVVSKAVSQAGVRSVITPLTREGRIEEIARMLGGVDITATTRRHAREMLAQAASPER